MGKLLHFLKPYKRRIALMLFLLFLQVLGTLYIPTLTASMVNEGIIKSDLSFVWKTSGYMMAVAAATAIVSICGTYAVDLLARNHHREKDHSDF